jgi:tetratricopeptide (TPR) repeat protein
LPTRGEGLMALETLEQAVALEPGNAVAHYNLAEAYREFGRHREALAEMERAVQ